MGGPYYDALETRDPAEREASLMTALPRIIAAAKEQAPAYRRLFAAVRPEEVADRRALARLPLTRKSDLIELQRQEPPFGGFAAVPVSALRRVFVSPGPIYEPEGRRPDFGRFARALFAAGFRAGDLVHNTFSYHMTPAGAMVESAAEALGCPVIPAGVGQTEQQLRIIADLKPVGYVGTPSFLKILLDRAAGEGTDVSSLKKALVGAEALPAALRAELRSRGVSVLQSYGTADLGVISYESTGPDGEVCPGMVLDEGIIVGTRRSRHRRPGSPGRSRRGRRDDPVAGIPADPLCHRRSLGDPARPQPVAVGPISGSRDGSAAPTRRPRCAACSCTPSRSPISCDVTHRSSAPAS